MSGSFGDREVRNDAVLDIPPPDDQEVMLDSTTLRVGITNGALGIASRVSAQLSIFLVTLVAARKLTIADFGTFAIASAILLLARGLFYVGPYEYMLKSNQDDDSRTPCLIANLIFAVVMCLIILPISFASNQLFQEPLVGRVLRALLPTIFMAMITAWFEAQLLRRHLLRRYYLQTVIGEAIAAIAALSCLYTGFGVYALVIQMYVRLVILGSLYWYSRDRRPLQASTRGDVVNVLRWSAPRYGSSVLNFFTNYGIDLVIGGVLAPAAAGLYRASARIVTTVTDLFSQPLQKFVQTSVSGRVASGRTVGDRWLDMVSAVCAICWAALAALGLFASDIIPVILGSKWSHAAELVTILCITRGMTMFDATSITVLICGDHQKDVLRIQMFVAPAIVLATFLAAAHGVKAVVFASSAVMISSTLTYATVAVRSAHIAPASVMRAFGRATLPAACVILSIMIARQAMPGSATNLERFVLEMASGGFGGLLGLFIIRRSLAIAMTEFGRGKH